MFDIQKLSDAARAEIVHDASEAVKIAKESYQHGNGQVHPDAIFAEIRLERRLSTVNPTRRVFEKKPVEVEA